MSYNNKKQLLRGFTLVEIAVVLVIFALVVTGVLRGQELINSAKARNIIDQKSGIQTAFLAFSNRFKAMPGDLTLAQANFIGNNVYPSSGTCYTVPCAGNGIIDLAGGESILFFQNLAATNFLSCASCMTVTTNGASSNSNTVINIYSQFLEFGTIVALAPPTTSTIYWLDQNASVLPARNVLTTGAKSSAAILQQVDIKADDSFAGSGLFRQSTAGGADATGSCTTSTGVGTSTVYSWSTTDANCAGAWLF